MEKLRIQEKYKIGIPTLLELPTLNENINFCREYGLNLLELNMNLPQFQNDKIRNHTFDSDIQISIHLSEETDVWNFNNRVREAYLDSVKETIEIAKLKSIELINMHMHSGVYFTLPTEKVYLHEKYLDQYIETTTDFEERISSLLRNENIKILIENTGIANRKYIQEAMRVLLKYSCFGLTWDIGHDYVNGNHDLEFMIQNQSKICHMHLHDVRGNSDHLPLGDGDLDFASIFNKISESNLNSIIIETKTLDGIRRSIEYLNERYWDAT